MLDILFKGVSEIEKRFEDKIEINFDLKRTLVSFQANKKIPGYRWYKFKEGYSYLLVDYVLEKLQITSGKLIDPFAGSGTSLFAAGERGIDSVGIEVLPIGQEIIEVRKNIFRHGKAIADFLEEWVRTEPWLKEEKGMAINYLNITKGAFPEGTEKLIGKYLKAISKVESKFRIVLRFALLCILEDISYTRKDGQYLRWDFRSGRGYGKNQFNKGEILNFNEAIKNKLMQIIDDTNGVKGTLFDFFEEKNNIGSIEVMNGSCLSLLKTLESDSFDVLMTSPPYCNRYDYTRTYALELALLGVDEAEIRKLRQDMLSCTVENKDKENLDQSFSKDIFHKALKAYEEQSELQEIIAFLEDKKEKKELNNSGIARMVKNYFLEMSMIIFECQRILKTSAPLIMVNDNVRYAGVNIPVDLILSDIAQKANFEVEKIWILPIGKGNSSQQMGTHGREELRKCVYIWRKL